MEKIIEKAFELGLPGFLLLIVLMVVSILVVKMFSEMHSNNKNIKDGMTDITSVLRSDFRSMSESLQALTERVINSNAEMSAQVAKSYTAQDNILNVMKETMVAVNNNTLRTAVLENKTETMNVKMQEMSVKMDTISEKFDDKLDDINLKLETLTHEIK